MLVQPPTAGPEMPHQKEALRSRSSLVLLLICKGAENDSNTKHCLSSSKCLFSPQDSYCYL